MDNKLPNPNINRRNLVAGASALAVAGSAVSVQSGAAASRQLSGKIRMQAGGYTPSESMEKSANNPVPIKAMQDAINAYTAENPDVEIELVRVPEGTDA